MTMNRLRGDACRDGQPLRDLVIVVMYADASDGRAEIAVKCRRRRAWDHTAGAAPMSRPARAWPSPHARGTV